MRARFHLAVPVDDLYAAHAFYADRLGCESGRQAERWIDLNFFDHQVTLHKVEQCDVVANNEVDRHDVPVRHFGIILPVDEWHQLIARLRAKDTDFLIEPGLRFQGEIGEQWTCFIQDPSGNALEFKAFPDESAVFTN